jgi:hypothetical protein
LFDVLRADIRNRKLPPGCRGLSLPRRSRNMAIGRPTMGHGTCHRCSTR